MDQNDNDSNHTQEEALQVTLSQDTDPERGEGENEGSSSLVYSIEDTPPWYLCLFLGFQHYLTSFGATIGNPLLVTPYMCITDDVTRSEIIGTIFVVSGIVTLIQTTVGIRLPVIQGGTFTFAVPILAILSLPKWRCPSADSSFNDTLTGDPTSTVPTNVAFVNNTPPMMTPEEIWQPRMREVQGAIIVASLIQIFIGATGIIGVMLRFIGPLVIAPTVCLTGLSLFDVATGKCQYLTNVNLPIFYINRKGKCKRTGYPVFKLFPVILAILLSWSFCAILTAADVFPQGHAVRTDTRFQTVLDARWVKFPYPGQWGLPTVSAAGVFGMFSGVLAGMFESIGDYYACARIADAPPPPIHAVNRGITVEGFGCVIAGLFGTGSGTTSYSENVGAIGITKVASRRVIQSGALLMIVFGVFGKFGALFVTIPDPVIGGVFMVMFGVIAAVGVSNLQFVDLNSTRNLFVFGFSVFFGLALPVWLKREENVGIINTGSSGVDQVITVLLSTSMFVGGFIAFVLDNTVPGTKKERGLEQWLAHLEKREVSKTAGHSCYDFPLVLNRICSGACKAKWTSYCPVCPSFKGFSDIFKPCCSSKQKKNSEENSRTGDAMADQDASSDEQDRDSASKVNLRSASTSL